MSHPEAAQDTWEAEALLRHIGPAEVVVEIGVWEAGSCLLWCSRLRPRLYVGVDETDRRKDGWQVPGVDQRFVWGRSQDASTVAAVTDHLDAPVDLLFIDGGHTEPEARADLALYGPLVRPGGHIALHDIHRLGDPGCDVWKVWPALAAGELAATFTSPNGNGIGALTVR